MFIELFKNNGVDYLRLMSSKRVVDSNGNKVARNHVELNIGPLSKYSDGQDNYLERLRQSFREGKPLIDKLLPYACITEEPTTHTLTFVDGNPECIGHPKYFSQCLLDHIFTEIGLPALFATIKHETKITYDLQGFVRLLVFGRILQPASKIATAAQNNDYFPVLVDDMNPFHVYDALDILHEYKEKIIRRMNSSITKKMGRNPALIFYDVTNFFFEIQAPDDDVEVDNEITKGLRKKGVSKENRKEPIVQMGLFLDDMGIPITIEMFPGNTLDQATLRPALKNSIHKLGFERFILVADRGLCSYKNTINLLDAGHGYIVSKSIKKSTAVERKWVLDPNDYIEKSENFKYKSRIITRTVKDEDEKTREITEKVVVYWSRDFYMREYHEHQSFLEFIEKLKKNPASFRVTASQSRSLKKFFKKEVVDKNTGEILDSSKLLTMIDDEKLEEQTAMMGYYQIVTSELEMEPLEVIDKYHGLTQIEDQFRVMKGDLETRPIFVRTPEHIEAHLLVCMIALTIVRILQKKLVSATKSSKTKEQFWTYGLSGERVQAALQKWKIESLPDEFYRFDDIDDPDLELILRAVGIHIPQKLYTRGDLKQLKSEISVLP